jgi:hypothetical protein
MHLWYQCNLRYIIGIIITRKDCTEPLSNNRHKFMYFTSWIIKYVFISSHSRICQFNIYQYTYNESFNGMTIIMFMKNELLFSSLIKLKSDFSISKVNFLEVDFQKSAFSKVNFLKSQLLRGGYVTKISGIFRNT